MDQLEQDLREGLARQVATPPTVLGLGDRVVQRGQRARRVRVAASVAAAAALAVAVGAGVLVGPPDVPGQVADASLDGPPRVPLVVRQGVGEVLDWPGGERRSRRVGEPAQPLALVPAGLLLLDGSSLQLLGPDDPQPREVYEGVVAGTGTVAVSADGRRAAVATASGVVREISLPDGAVLRQVTVGGPNLRPGEPLLVAGYSGATVLLSAGEGADRRALLWEAAGGEERVAGLAGNTGALAGSAGLGAFTVEDARCRVEVVDLETGGGSWRLCREQLIGFSPDGRWVLAANAVGDGLVVHDAQDGDVRRRFDVPRGLRAYAWESGDTLLHTTIDGAGSTVVVRCGVRSGACRTAATFPYVDRIPEPVPPALG